MDPRKYAKDCQDHLSDAESSARLFINNACPQNDNAEDALMDIQELADRLKDLERLYEPTFSEIIGDYDEE